MRLREGLIAGALVLTLAGGARAQLSIDFLGLTSTNIQGQTINGVTFDYFRGAVTGSVIGGGWYCSLYVCNESIQDYTINASLVMTFVDPAQFFQFGLVGFGYEETEVSVALFDPYGFAMGTEVLSLTPEWGAGWWVEGQYSWNGAAVGSVAIDLDYDPNMPDRFIFDNVEFELAPDDWEDPVVLGPDGPEVPPTVTPEPISMVLLGTGLAGIGGVARRRRRNQDSG